ncbi:S10 family peptidase [Parafilimonas terrae]|uniref:Carboxypeptidase C (Cathepsin A) n=1 Tax=Parafilimonas terrae TaxID=1465490 RepID=A0A1I5YVX9_9BACT|nr:peptidase S10 [Parafilimonas terrae]SFQ48428.1 Carboxypeptidase C (cathepsin A) [Parafilimonas terrae]
MKRILALGVIFFVSGFVVSAQQKKEMFPAARIDNSLDSAVVNYKKQQRSITYGSVTVEGKAINYEAVAGSLVFKNAQDTPIISMSYTAYFKRDDDPAQRPLTFIYNGGPGSSTIWLHMGAWGPQRVYIADTERTKAPYKTVNNDYSLLDASDLVFIDAPGTGFGQVITKDLGGAGNNKDFFGIDQDGQAFASFITKFLSDYNRWNSPKYLFGESYGTFRSAVVANILGSDKGVALNGIILLSQLLTYGNMTEMTQENPGDGLPFELVLPSFAATAWYHHKLPNQPANLEPFLAEVENFALTDYAIALNKGAALDAAQFNQVAEKLHQYTGLPVDYIKKANLRIIGPQFEQTLLGDSSKITGRLDSRFSGAAIDPLSEYAQYDPMDSYIDGAFTATFNNYVRTTLKYGIGMNYKTFGNVHPWDFKRRGFVGFPNVMNDLAQAMIYNPDMKVMLNMGYFDLGTPYFEGIYEMQHLPIPVALQKNIEYAKYQSGHMVYLHPESLKLLHDNVAKFINASH